MIWKKKRVKKARKFLSFLSSDHRGSFESYVRLVSYDGRNVFFDQYLNGDISRWCQHTTFILLNFG